MGYLNSQGLAARYRGQSIDLKERRVLITHFIGTEQEHDLSVAPNCAGFGRVRHFVRKKPGPWIENPLPLDPACAALHADVNTELRAQVFQNAACNWRCWYCFVPFTLLDANKSHSRMMTADELISLWIEEPDRPQVIDLSGGQPEITPEWVLWMMQSLMRRGLERSVYLWSDDNLSTDYFWTALSDEERGVISSYPLYGRVCCFKGFDSSSFSFNTMAAPDEYQLQFDRMAKLLELGIDLYAYVTLTTPDVNDIAAKLNQFADRLQGLHENLPLRMVPLRIETFKTNAARFNAQRDAALENQFRVLEEWRLLLESRYSSEQRNRRIYDVPIGARVKHGA